MADADEPQPSPAPRADAATEPAAATESAAATAPSETAPSETAPSETAPSETARSAPPETARDRAPATIAPAPDEPRAWKVAAAIFALCLAVFAAFAAERLAVHSPDNHFAYLADSYLHGTLEVRCAPEALQARTCPPGGGGNDWALYNNRWFVAFPSFPAVVYMPAVALFGRDFANRRLDVALAALAPALLYLLLARLSREKKSSRTWRENVLFSLLHAFGTVFFFSAVQGSVWFVAHIVASSLVVGYLWFALDARNPLAAGALLAMAIHTRANLVYIAPWFALEALRTHRLEGHPAPAKLTDWWTGLDARRALKALVLFALPVAAGLALTAWLNDARFGDPGEVGYRFLQIGWRGRIERWGLFNYHYLGRNLAIFLASTPWFSRDFPYVVISLHGLAIWVTTPHYLELLRLRAKGAHGYTPFLALSAGTVLLVLLLYQNSGWVQFGFRFSNDIAPIALVLLALNGAPIRRAWVAAFVLAVLVNAFGAWSFERQIVLRGQRVTFYDNDYTQNRLFQPD